MVAVNIQHEQLILVCFFFFLIFKIVPQTAVSPLHGDAALDLNSCSVSLYTSLLHEECVERGNMASRYRPKKSEFKIPCMPLLEY